MNCICRFCSVTATIVALSGWAQGASILADQGLDGGRLSDVFGQSLVIGTQFTVGNANVQVNSLGVWDQAGDGFLISHNVGLWNSAGALLASATVPAGTVGTLENTFRYVPIGSDVTLLAGQPYRVAALYPLSGDPWNDPYDPPGAGVPPFPKLADGVALHPGSGIAAINQDSFAVSGTLVEPVNSGGGTLGRWGAANARFVAAVPEPTAIVLGSLCGLVMLLVRKPTLQRS